MKYNWKMGNAAYILIQGKVIKVDIREVEGECLSIYITGSSVGWHIENDEILFHTEKEALQQLQQEEQKRREQYDSKEKLVALFLDAAEDMYNESQMRVIRELIPKHFGVDVPKE